MNKGIAIRIDIETELKAIHAGQCGGCRVGITHPISIACYKYRENYAKMAHCGKCNYMYSIDNFETCPVCKKEGK